MFFDFSSFCCSKGRYYLHDAYAFNRNVTSVTMYLKFLCNELLCLGDPSPLFIRLSCHHLRLWSSDFQINELSIRVLRASRFCFAFVYAEIYTSFFFFPFFKTLGGELRRPALAHNLIFVFPLTANQYLPFIHAKPSRGRGFPLSFHWFKPSRGEFPSPSVKPSRGREDSPFFRSVNPRRVRRVPLSSHLVNLSRGKGCPSLSARFNQVEEGGIPLSVHSVKLSRWRGRSPLLSLD